MLHKSDQTNQQSQDSTQARQEVIQSSNEEV